MSLIKLHPNFILRIENNAAYGIQKETQDKIKSANHQEALYFYLASLGKYDFSCQQLKDWLKRKFIVKGNEKGQKLDATKEKMNLEKLMASRPKEYTQYPLMLTLGITNKCVCHCQHCGNDSGPQSKISIELPKIKEIIDQCYQMKVLKLTLTGGEPFIRDDIFQIISFAVEKIPRVSITTNTALVTRETVRKLAEAKISMVKISLDGLEDFHDNFRQYAGIFQNALKTIKHLKEKGIEVRVQSTLLRRNQEDLLKLLAITGQLGVNVHSIVPLSPIGRACQKDMLTPKEYLQFIKKFIEKVSWLKNKTVYQIRPIFDLDIKLNLITLSTKYKCQALVNTIEIQPSGDIIPCSFFILKLGNIYQDNLKDVWLSQETNKVRDYFKPDNLQGLCQQCSARESCGGGCLANAYALYNKLYLRDIYCWK